MTLPSPPTPPVPPTEIRVLAFDPGITVMGWSVLSYDTTTHKTIVVDHGTITGPKLLKERKELQNRFAKQFIILEVYYELFCRFITEHTPHYVVIEGAFYYRFAQTYASLTLVIHTLRRACLNMLNADVHEVAPMETKATITGNKMADKNLIKASLLGDSSIQIHDNDETAIEAMTEHEFDAIGHGLTFIRKHLGYEKKKD